MTDDVMGTTDPPVEQHPGESLVMISDDECDAACGVKNANLDDSQPSDPTWPKWFDPMVQDSQPDPGPDWKPTPPKVPEAPAARVGVTPCGFAIPQFLFFSITHSTCFLFPYEFFFQRTSWFAWRFFTCGLEAAAPDEGFQDPPGCPTNHSTLRRCS